MVSTKMQKTIVVEVSRRVPHPLYKRIIGKRKKFYAHDEEGTAKLGDVVRIVECRPLSKLKRWQLVEVVRRAPQVGVAAEGSGREGLAVARTQGRSSRLARRAVGCRARGAEQFMIGMRTILEVADNSGARRLSCILPRGGDLGLRAGLGDVVTAARERGGSRFGDQEGQSGALRDRPHAQGDAAQGRHVHPLRFQRGRADQRSGRAGGHARVRAGGRELRDKKFMKIVSLAPEVI